MDRIPSPLVALLLALLALLALPLDLALAQPAADVTSDIDAVTVYRGQALVTRLVKVDAEPGLHELVVGDLPQHVIAGSVYAEAEDGLEIRSVRYRTRPVRQDVREEVRELDAQIQDVQDDLRAVEQQQDLVRQGQAYLKQLAAFTAETGKADLEHGVLDAEALQSLSDYIFEQHRSIMQAGLDLTIEHRELAEQLNLLQRQKSQITTRSTDTAREAVVFAALDGPQARFRLYYLVNAATWSPSYTVRAAGRENVQLDYHASIQQTSGEDWASVKMTLSTATPALIATAPELEPLSVTLAGPREAADRATGQGGYAFGLARGANATEAARQLRTRKLEANRRREQAAVAADLQSERQAAAPARQADEINALAGQLQVLELVADKADVDDAQERDTDPEAVVTVTYELPDRTSLPSRADRQLIRIASAPLPASFYRVATPVLTSRVYREAELRNTSDRVLLAGPVACYLDGQFVGHGTLPTIAAGERFNVGFGIDASLRAERELTDRQADIQGGNRVVQSTYALRIHNFADQPADLRLLDRIPTTEDGQAVRIQLTDPGQPLSDDPLYQQTRRPEGILRWDLTVPADAVAADAFTLSYTFTMEHDRQQTITGLSTPPR